MFYNIFNILCIFIFILNLISCSDDNFEPDADVDLKYIKIKSNKLTETSDSGFSEERIEPNSGKTYRVSHSHADDNHVDGRTLISISIESNRLNCNNDYNDLGDDATSYEFKVAEARARMEASRVEPVPSKLRVDSEIEDDLSDNYRSINEEIRYNYVVEDYILDLQDSFISMGCAVEQPIEACASHPYREAINDSHHRNMF